MPPHLKVSLKCLSLIFSNLVFEDKTGLAMAGPARLGATALLEYLGVVQHEIGQGTFVSEQDAEWEGGESSLVVGRLSKEREFSEEHTHHTHSTHIPNVYSTLYYIVCSLYGSVTHSCVLFP